MFQQSLIALVVALALAACATTTARNTPSGKPEVVIGASPAAVKSAIASAMLSAGFEIQKDSQFQLVFGKRGDPVIGVTQVWGHIVTISVVEQGHGSRIVADTVMVMNYGTTFQTQNVDPVVKAFNNSTREIEAQVDGILAGVRNRLGAT